MGAGSRCVFCGARGAQVLKDQSTGKEDVLFLTAEQQKNEKWFRTPEGGELETIEKESLTDYLAENYKKWGCVIEFVTNRSQEGSQFCKGFGGIGGMLRWKLDFQALEGAVEMDKLDQKQDTPDDAGADDGAGYLDEYGIDIDADFGF